MPKPEEVVTTEATDRLVDRVIKWLTRFDMKCHNSFAGEFPAFLLSEIDSLCDDLNEYPNLYAVQELPGARGVAYFSECLFKFHSMPFVIRFVYVHHTDKLSITGVWHGKWKRPKLVPRSTT